MEGRGSQQVRSARVAISPDDLEGAALLLSRVSNPRAAVCLAASWVLRADVAELWEPTAAGPVLRASTQEQRFVAPAPAIVAEVIARGQPRRARRGRDDGTVLVEPVRRGRRAIAALLVHWRRDVEEIDATSHAFLSLLTAQAALAIEHADLSDELARQAETDPLTGVANRRGLARALERDLAAARRNATPLAVALIDLDHFKAYNDAHGHPDGDLLLRAAARAWGGRLRAGDLLARYGGEEFAIVLPDAGGSSEASAVVDRVRAATPIVSASAGVALWNGREPAAQLIRRADGALYEAKRSGRDRTVLAAPVTAACAPSSSRTGSR